MVKVLQAALTHYLEREKMFRIEHNVETGEVTEIELTAKEIKEIESDLAKSEAQRASEQANRIADAEARAALLAQLGITEEQAKLLLG